MKVLIFICFSISLVGQKPFSDKFANTYSIVAKDPKTGYFGVAVQSNWFGVGNLCAWAEAGVGAVATQSMVNVEFGPKGLKLLKEGKTAKEALSILLKEDEGREWRQVAVVDKNGNTAVHTGSKCIIDAGDFNTKNFSVQANLMANNTVWNKMAEGYKSAKGEFADRLIQALESAQKAGGDIRGKQSAAILIVKDKPSGKSWEDVVLDLKVDDHKEPLKELRRLYNVHTAYQYMNEGDLHVEHNDMKKALKAYGTAQKMFPENLEMKYWTAIALLNNGDFEQGKALMKDIYSKGSNWKLLTPRLIKNGILSISKAQLNELQK